MAEIRHLILFIHPPVTYLYHRLLEQAPNIAANAVEIVASRPSDVTTTTCVI